MSTSEARARANRAWRERTGLKLVQAYLHADTVKQLDKLVKERGATGRATVLADLIEQAALPAPQAVPAPDVVDRQPDTGRCECGTASGDRCRNKTTSIIKAAVDGRIAEYGSCKRHVRDFRPHGCNQGVQHEDCVHRGGIGVG